MAEITNKFDFINVENKWRDFWESNQIYKSTVNENKPKYSVVIPPPNVTGILHIGHILNNTIQDIYCRWHRMKGYEVCWVPGMDHAGISTQIMVEKSLEKQGKKKTDFSREDFVKLIWDWKEKHGGIILRQLRKLGVSVDWSRERFTLDEGLSKAVRYVFVDLYKKGLIYRGKRIINWDIKTHTALSDDEIVYKEMNDKLYYVKYPVAESDEFITIATTRPETMFGDTAVAVHPDDDRYKHLKGKQVILPLVNRKIDIIFDRYVDREFGTGALKITPAHDINDFEVGRTHNLQSINILTTNGILNEEAGEFAGLNIKEGRKKTVAKLKENGYLIKEENYTHNVAFGDKSNAVIEPLLSDQWFVKMKELSVPALEAVNKGEVRFHPSRYVKVYNHWLENIRDWCISRQLWWGHQIPIWYHKNTGEIYCEVNPPEDIDNYRQDPDVLDTWFSSWLWPFSVFGWDIDKNVNSKNKDLMYYYPTDFLSTAADIIFLWVARMIISGLEYMGDVPFKDVYFHSIIRDGEGRKMSKTLGNSPDPLDVMDKYGTDALRFTLIFLAPLGNDILYDESKTEIGRNFITKVWNAARFLLMNRDKVESSEEYGDEPVKDNKIDVWINSRLNSTLVEIEKNLNEFKLNEYTKSVYTFVWNDFCDWYIEMLKIRLTLYKESGKTIVSNAIELFKKILIILHPAAPFVTEELWSILNDNNTKTISFESFPVCSTGEINIESENSFNKFREIVIAIRNIRTENQIPFKEKCDVYLNYDALDITLNINTYLHYISSICNVDLKLNISSIGVRNTVTRVLNELELKLVLPSSISTADNLKKYQKEAEKLESYLNSLNKKLSNENFLAKASPDVIEAEKVKQTETQNKLSKLKELINSLS